MKVGDRYVDRDSRNKGRVVRIHTIGPVHVYVENVITGHKTRLMKATLLERFRREELKR